jgi:DNA-binding IclR family transcriptional regulator
MYDGLNWDKAPSLETYLGQVEQTKQKGWAIDSGDFIKGITTIAAPVDIGQNQFRFCLSIALFGDQNDPEFIDRVAADLISSAERIAERLFLGGSKLELTTRV